MAKAIDISGQRFGRLVAIERHSTDKHGLSLWLCRCDCGKESVHLLHSLRRGNTKSCGCLRKEPAYNRKTKPGQVYGSLTIIGEPHIKNKHMYWKCLCTCGKTTTVQSDHLLSGHTTTCGHLNYETQKELTKNNEKYRNKGIMTLALKRKLQSNNKTGVKGVFKKKNGHYRADIGVGGKNIYLGTFESIDDAITARLEAEEKYHKPYLEADNHQ